MFQSSLDEVVHEVDDLDQEPGEDEIREYAELIGIDPDKDPDLLWIARAGITAPLPADWKPIQVNNGDELYFYNFKTGESSWEHPSDEKYRQLVAEERKKKSKSGPGILPAKTPGKPPASPASISAATAALKPLKQPAASPSPLGKLAPIGGGKPSPLGGPPGKLQPINAASTSGPPAMPKPPAGKALAPIGQSGQHLERPKTSRGPTENEKAEAAPKPAPVLGGGSRFLKKADNQTLELAQSADAGQGKVIQNVLRIPSEDDDSDSGSSLHSNSHSSPGNEKENVIMDLKELKPSSVPAPAVPANVSSKPPVAPKSTVQPSTGNSDAKSQAKIDPPKPPAAVTTPSSPAPVSAKPPSPDKPKTPTASPPTAVGEASKKTSSDASESVEKVERQLQEEYERRVKQLREQHDAKLKEVRAKFEEEEKKETEKIKRAMEDRLRAFKEKLQKDEDSEMKTLAMSRKKQLDEKELADEEKRQNAEKKRKVDEARDRLQKELDQWYRKEKERKTAMLKNDIDKELADVRKNMEAERRTAMESEITRDLERRRRDLQEQHERQLADIRKEHEAELDHVRRTNKVRVDSELTTHQHKTDRIHADAYNDLGHRQDEALKAAEQQLRSFRDELSALTRMTADIRHTLQPAVTEDCGKRHIGERRDVNDFRNGAVNGKHEKGKVSPNKAAVVKSIDELLSPDAQGDQSSRTPSSLEQKLEGLESEDVLDKVTRFLESLNTMDTRSQHRPSSLRQQPSNRRDHFAAEDAHTGAVRPVNGSLLNLQRNLYAVVERLSAEAPRRENVFRAQPKDVVDEFLDRKIKEYFHAHTTMSPMRDRPLWLPSAVSHDQNRFFVNRRRGFDVESELNSLKRWLAEFENRISDKAGTIHGRSSSLANGDRDGVLPIEGSIGANKRMERPI